MRNQLIFSVLQLIFITCLLLRYQISLVQGSIACGGFLKSIVNINYSRVSIKLYTASGNLKYTSEGAPNNGYYFIPVYDNGDYILKVDAPKGWKFEPKQVVLKIDGSTDPCSQGHDINFAFKGFTITGKILSDSLDSGPQGVEVTLKAKPTNNILKSTQTTLGGDYFFEEVLPGSYEIVADEKKFTYIGSNKASLTVTDDNVNLSPKEAGQVIVMSGYPVKGQVTSDGEPIKGVHFALYSLSGKKRLPADCNQDFIEIPSKSKQSTGTATYLCHTLSGNDGYFQFGNLSPGNYRLVAFYRGNNIEFGVEPKFIDFKVEHEPVVFQEGFKVEGFSVKGRVLTRKNGHGISGAQVLVTDDKGEGLGKIINSQEDGVFHLENMRSGTYTLQVTAAHILFETKSVKISPVSPEIPDIIASAFEICGQFKFQSTPTELKVNILKSSEKNFISHQTVDTEAGGSFCTFLRSGTYRIEPVVPKKLENELIFTPRYLDLEVKEESVLDLVFNQFAASISGSLVLKEAKSSVDDISIDLEVYDSGDLVSSVKPNRQSKEFKFMTVFPGKYRLKVRKSDGLWCWKDDQVEITISDNDLKEIKFHQTGYYMTLITSHPIRAQIVYPDGKKQETIEINEVGQPSGHCLAEPGRYEIIPVSCHIFEGDNGETTQFTFDTQSKEGLAPLVLKASQHELTGTFTTIVHTNSSDEFSLSLTRKTNAGAAPVTTKLELKPVEATTDQEGNTVKTYKISLFAKPNEIIKLEPHSSQLLFKPTVVELTMGNDCLIDQVSFKGRAGLFIKGKITPPLEGVKISLYRRKSNELLYETVTDSEGKYVSGPFDCCDGIPVREEMLAKAEKDGYLLKESTTSSNFGDFISEKLSSLIVQVSNGDDEKEPPLPEVLISISGGSDNFRKNLITPANGELAFIGLNPGQYYMRAVLKEFQFEPSSKIVDIKQGETIKIKVKGHRVAYSCYGTTVSLSGEAEQNVMVEAVGVGGVNHQGVNCSQLQEEVSSENNGNFRIRDLKPGCSYQVSVKKYTENSPIARSLPESVLINVQNADIEGIKLILFPQSNSMEVTGDILTNPEFWPSLRVKLFSESSGDQLLASLPINSAFFAIPLQIPLDNQWYTLKLESTLPTYSYSYDIPSINFKANVTYSHFQFKFSPKKINHESYGSGDQDNIGGATNGSMFTLPLIIIVGLLIYNHDRVKPVYHIIVEKVQAAIKFSYDFRGNSNQASLGGDSNNAARRRLKNRRT